MSRTISLPRALKLLNKTENQTIRNLPRISTTAEGLIPGQRKKNPKTFQIKAAKGTYRSHIKNIILLKVYFEMER